MAKKDQAGAEKLHRTEDGFTSRWGFILACIGSAVGMGNIWRFPIMVSTYGGMTFLIPYIICVVLIGASGVMEEFALGRFDKYIAEVNKGTGIRMSPKLKPYFKYVLPVLILIILLNGLI